MKTTEINQLTYQHLYTEG